MEVKIYAEVKEYHGVGWGKEIYLILFPGLDVVLFHTIEPSINSEHSFA